MNAFEDHIQWNAVKEVCSRLKTAGFEALLAGGCVRDLLMNREPHDFDVATDARPDEVEALFERSVAVGKAFGVIVLPFEDFQIEVATFRQDLDYKDGRRPEGVTFSTPEADAQRRDFTVNALFYDPVRGEIVDYVDGRKDIEAKILRTVGDPNRRFDEDKLRILRAIRFAAQLDFAIEPRTLEAIVQRAQDVAIVSRERIRDEILKLLKASRRRKGLELLLKTGVLAALFPELSKKIDDCESKWLTAFDRLEASDDETALLALFLWPYPPAAQDLRLDNQTQDALSHIFRELENALNPSRIAKGELAFILTKSFAPSLLLTADTLARADALAHELGDRTVWNEALRAARPDGVTPTPPLLTGRDLIAMGMKPGPRMGEILHRVFLMQLEGEIATKAEAEKLAKSLSER
jgi:poly(A) polymerase